MERLSLKEGEVNDLVHRVEALTAQLTQIQACGLHGTHWHRTELRLSMLWRLQQS